MDKISKALKKLSSKEQRIVKVILEKLYAQELKGLRVKKLKGFSDIFRVRKSRIRIIYRARKDKEIFILSIERRSEGTYKSFRIGGPYD